VFEYRDCALRAIGGANDSELVAAPLDGDVEFSFDLAKVVVKRSGQMRQLNVVAFDVKHESLAGGRGSARHVGVAQKKRRNYRASFFGSALQPLDRTMVAFSASLSAS
jgi:hypothetical protein